VSRAKNQCETLAKGLRILDLYHCENPGFTLSEISGRIGVNKTSAYRYLNTLMTLGYLVREERSRRYKLGARTMALAHAFLQRSEAVQLVKPLVDEVHRHHDLHVDVGMLQGDAIYLIYRRETKDTMAFRSFTNGSEPYCLAAGKAAMAFMEEKELQALLGRLTFVHRTASTITDPQRLMAELALTRRRGYAVNREEFIPGLIAIGAPLISRSSSRVVGGISFDSSTALHTLEAFEEKYATLLVELAKKISAAISS
jgi:IclR family pca regulon transcriptional regulator